MTAKSFFRENCGVRISGTEQYFRLFLISFMTPSIVMLTARIWSWLNSSLMSALKSPKRYFDNPWTIFSTQNTFQIFSFERRIWEYIKNQKHVREENMIPNPNAYYIRMKWYISVLNKNGPAISNIITINNW